MELGLEGKLAVITGAARGIGAAMAEAFAREGAQLLLIDRSESVDEAAAQLGGKALLGDIAAAELPEQAAVLAAELGGAAVLVNNAGISAPAPFAAISRQDWQRVLDVNLNAAFRLTQALWPQLTAAAGAVVNIASFAAKRPTLFGDNASYVVSKHGLAGLTRAAGFEGASQGVRVNAIAPGVVDTDLVKLHGAAKRAQITDLIPQRRFAAPAEIADLALFLASERARHICGEVVNINGGLHMD